MKSDEAAGCKRIKPDLQTHSLFLAATNRDAERGGADGGKSAESDGRAT